MLNSTIQTTLEKAFVLCAGIPADTILAGSLQAQIEREGHWGAMDREVNAYFWYEANRIGSSALITKMAEQGFNLKLSPAQAGALAAAIDSGQNTWSELVWQALSYTGQLGATLANKAQAAQAFTDALLATGNGGFYSGAGLYGGLQMLLSGVDEDPASVAGARASLEQLAAHLSAGGITGKAIDGYLVGATVFVDSNGNGTLDSGEISTTTDGNGDFTLPSGLPGQLVAFGGTDLMTGQGFEGVLTAPVGATVITPLTTLVAALHDAGSDSAAAAAALVSAKLGLPEGIPLLNYDPMPLLARNEDTARATEVLRTGLQVANFISVVSVAVDAAVGLERTAAAKLVIEALAARIGDGSGFDLTAADDLGQVITGVVQALIGDVPGAPLVAIIEQVATLSAAVNQETAVASSVAQLARVSHVVQANLGPALEQAMSGSSALSDVVVAFTEANLATEIWGVGDSVGSFIPGVPVLPAVPVPPDVADPADAVARPTVTGLSNDSGLAGDFVTNLAAQTVSGSYTGLLAEGQKIQASADGTTWVDATVVGATWSAALTLSEGPGTLSVRSVDAAGAVLARASLEYRLDTEAPLATAAVTGLGADTGTAGDFITRTASQTVSGTYSGTLGQGETIQVSADGANWIDATAAANAWSAQGVTLGATGVLAVRTIDLAGNTRAGTGHDYSLDDTPPAASATLRRFVGESAWDVRDQQQTVEGQFTGTLGADDRFEVSVDGTNWVTATVLGSGNPDKFRAEVTLVPGTGTLSVRTVDGAGNTLEGTGHGYSFDNVAPQALTVALANDTGASGADRITRDATLALTGQEDGAALEYSTDDTNWHASFTAAEGGNTVYVRQVDAAGNASASTALSFTYDTSAAAPGVSLRNDTGNSGIDKISNDAALSVTAEDEASVTYSTDQIDWSSSFAASEGSNTVYVRQTDLAGNLSSAAAFSFTLDTAAPGAPTVVLGTDTGSSSSDAVTSSGALSLTGVTDTVEYSSDGTNWHASFTAAEGGNTVSVRQVDAAGNASGSSTLSFTLDTTAPTALAAVTGLGADTGTAGDFITRTASQTVSGTYSGTLGQGETIQVSADGASWIDAAAAAGAWSAQGVTLGATGVLAVRTIDLAGNTRAGTGHDYSLDTQAPQMTAGPVVADGTRIRLTADGAATAGLYKTIAGVDTLVGSAASLSANVAGTISVAGQATLTSGLLVKLTDAAGNESSSPANVILGRSGAADTITATAAQDLMFGFGGTPKQGQTAGSPDIFVLQGGTVDVLALDQIGGFVISGNSGVSGVSDVLKAGGTAAWTTAITGWTITGGVLSKANATVSDFYQAVVAATGTVHQVAVFAAGGNTYVFGEGASTADNDNLAVVLVGVTGVSGFGTGNQQIELAA